MVVVSIPYWLGSKLRGHGQDGDWKPHQAVSIPYWLGSKLRGELYRRLTRRNRVFQSPIGWGLSCECIGFVEYPALRCVSIPYWLGSKLRVNWPNGGRI